MGKKMRTKQSRLSSTLAVGTHGYCNNCIQQAYRIRKLTPKECWRLMGYTDTDFEKAAKVNSNTQRFIMNDNQPCKHLAQSAQQANESKDYQRIKKYISTNK